MGVDEVLAALHGLTIKDLDRVRVAATGLVASRRKQDKTVAQDTVERQLFNIIVLRVAQIEHPSWTQFTRSPSYVKFVQRVPVVVRWLDEHAVGLTQVQRYHLLDCGISLLCRDLSRRGTKPSVRLVVHCLGDLPSVLDRAFPGYAEAGLLHMVVRVDGR